GSDDELGRRAGLSEERRGLHGALAATDDENLPALERREILVVDGMRDQLGWEPLELGWIPRELADPGRDDDCAGGQSYTVLQRELKAAVAPSNRGDRPPVDSRCRQLLKPEPVGDERLERERLHRLEVVLSLEVLERETLRRRGQL